MAGEIEVRLQHGWVDVAEEDLHFGFEPIVHLAADVTAFRILAVGRHATFTEPTIQVAVFDPLSVAPGNRKFKCLEAMFAYGLQELVNRKILRLKPLVRVFGAKGLAPSFAGYQEMLIESSLLAAGARAVTFVTD